MIPQSDPTSQNPGAPSSPAPPPTDLLHRLFGRAVQNVNAVSGAITGSLHAVQSAKLYREIAPKLHDAFEEVLPADLADGEQSVADFISKHQPQVWDEILAGAGPIATAFVQGVLARTAAGAVGLKAAAVAGAAGSAASLA